MGIRKLWRIMSCNCTKGTRVNDSIETNNNNNNNNNVKERRRRKFKIKTSKKKKNSASSSKANVGSEETSGFNGNINEATLSLLIPTDAKNNVSLTTLSSSDEAEKKVNIERKSSKSMFQRKPTFENNNVGTLQQSKMTRISSFGNGERGAQVIAGWPLWLASVAGEAINGWIPRKADSFEKMQKIGQGTYSSVYKARDLETNQIVALKKVRFANMDPESVRFMAREIIILRRLDHPNVMKLEGLITSRVSGSMYLIFEYMEHDLTRLASTPGVKFSEAQVKCYMKQLLHGLEYCHSQGVLHRDIKGSNLLLDQNNNLKIGDFGLANFHSCNQKQPLTSRVVTLWYRAPELLLGSTDYGVTVDMWSTGCVLAELFTRKPIMAGRTEVEQLHKIFKLCGSPSDEYWKRSKLPHATIFKPQHPYKRCVAETFKNLPSSALALVEVLLAVEPDARGTTASALQSEFFTTEPFASDPSSLPKYQPRIDVKVREEEARLKKDTSGKQNESKQLSRESKALPAPDVNAELPASVQKRQEMAMNEKFNPEEDTTGFCIEAMRTGTGQNSETRYGMSSVNRKETSVMRGSSRSPQLRTQRSFVQRGAAQLSRYSNSVAARDGSHFAIANPRWFEDSCNNSNRRQNGGDWSQRLLVKHKYCIRDKESISDYGEKTERMHYSGPLISSRVDLDEMLKEHERQIRLAVHKAQVDKKTNRDDNKQSQTFLAPNGR